jgi:hypothetical protein
MGVMHELVHLLSKEVPRTYNNLKVVLLYTYILMFCRQILKAELHVGEERFLLLEKVHVYLGSFWQRFWQTGIFLRKIWRMALVNSGYFTGL